MKEEQFYLNEPDKYKIEIYDEDQRSRIHITKLNEYIDMFLKYGFNVDRSSYQDSIYEIIDFSNKTPKLIEADDQRCQKSDVSSKISSKFLRSRGKKSIYSNIKHWIISKFKSKPKESNNDVINEKITYDSLSDERKEKLRKYSENKVRKITNLNKFWIVEFGNYLAISLPLECTKDNIIMSCFRPVGLGQFTHKKKSKLRNEFVNFYLDHMLGFLKEKRIKKEGMFEDDCKMRMNEYITFYKKINYHFDNYLFDLELYVFRINQEKRKTEITEIMKKEKMMKFIEDDRFDQYQTCCLARYFKIMILVEMESLISVKNTVILFNLFRPDHDEVRQERIAQAIPYLPYLFKERKLLHHLLVVFNEIEKIHGKKEFKEAIFYMAEFIFPKKIITRYASDNEWDLSLYSCCTSKKVIREITKTNFKIAFEIIEVLSKQDFDSTKILNEF